MKNRFEYVASGGTFFRLFHNTALWDTQKEIFRKSFGTLDGNNNHRVSLLYNAYTEHKQGAILREHYADTAYTIHADSGGLQIVTRGFNITDDLKNKVYENQAKYSDIAMCFDKIPVRVTSDKSKKLDLENRFYDHAMLDEAAKETGINLRTQIEYFLEVKAKAKPFLIIQGNDYDSYMKWTEIVMKQLPEGFSKHIGGVAMGAAALGKGTLEDIKRAFYFKELPLDVSHKHVHLLGVGAVPRMIPTIIFVQNGLYGDTTISYDSTTHTASITRGLYFMGQRMFNYSRDFSHDYDIVRKDIEKNFPGVYPLSTAEMYECLNVPPGQIAEKYGSTERSVQTAFCYVSSAIKNFIVMVEQLNEKKSNVIDFLKTNKEKTSFSSLYEVKTRDDFDHWLKHVGPYIDSEPVRVYNERSTLESFFE